MITIASRTFYLKDQRSFAQASGDRNPIHVDPIFARRTISGQCIVHGIHGLMWALDAWCSVYGKVASGLRVRFAKPILLGEPVECRWQADSNRLVIASGSNVLTSITVDVGEVSIIAISQVRVTVPNPEPNVLSFEQCVSLQSQEFFFRGDSVECVRQFPSLAAQYGTAALAELAALSEIVGMQVPGLHSIFLSVDVRFRFRNQSVSRVDVVRSDARFSTIDIAVEALTLRADIKTFCRPPPVLNPSISELRKSIAADEFCGVRALVVGGSRGLGELVARMLAAGGAQVVVTYNVGMQEARQLQYEVRAAGGSCEILQMTVDENVALPVGAGRFDLYCHFATPKIFGKRVPGYDASVYRGFADVYVYGFERLSRALLERNRSLAILYPSTVAIDKPLPDLQEYIDAKVAGEGVCAALSSELGARVLCPRLPRLATDQTHSMVKVPTEDSVGVLLPILLKIGRRTVS